MHFALVNQSKSWPAITPTVIELIAEAVEIQLCTHFARVWQAQGCVVSSEAVLKDPDASPILLLDSADDPGALGDHETTAAGLPIARIFIPALVAQGATLMGGSNSLSATISHEALEALADPYANGFAVREDGVLIAQEVSDPVEDLAYEINGVSVSAFVGPRWFRQGAGPYGYGCSPSAPWAVNPNGYTIQWTPGGVPQAVFGERVSPERKAYVLSKRRVQRRLSMGRLAA